LDLRVELRAYKSSIWRRPDLPRKGLIKLLEQKKCVRNPGELLDVKKRKVKAGSLWDSYRRAKDCNLRDYKRRKKKRVRGVQKYCRCKHRRNSIMS